MISIINPEDQTPAPRRGKYLLHEDINKAYSGLGGPFPGQETMEEFSKAVSKAHLEFTTMKVQDALIAKFGEMPSLALVAKHCHCVLDEARVAHYLWLDEPPKPGDKIDMENLLCTVEPPEFGTYEEP